MQLLNNQHFYTKETVTAITIGAVEAAKNVFSSFELFRIVLGTL